MPFYCCSFNSRTGCLVAGYFTMTTRLLAIIYLSVVLALWNNSIKLAEIGSHHGSSYHLNSSIFYYCGLVLAIVCVVVSVILLYGTNKNYRICFVPWIAWIGFELVCDLTAAGFIFYYIYKASTDGTFIAESILVIVLHLSIHTYLMLRVISHYTTLKKESIIPYCKQKDEYKLSSRSMEKYFTKELTMFPPYQTGQQSLPDV